MFNIKSIVTYLSITPDCDITLNPETHVYTLSLDNGRIKLDSDTSVTKIINNTGSSFISPKMASAAQVGRQKHLLVEKALHAFRTSGLLFSEYCLAYMSNPDRDPVVLAFLANIEILCKRTTIPLSEMQFVPEVKLFSIITDDEGNTINVGGSIDVLVILPNQEFWILDLKTTASSAAKASNATKYCNQILTYAHLIAARDKYQIIRGAYIYSDEIKYVFDFSFTRDRMQTFFDESNPQIKNFYFQAMEKKFSPLEHTKKITDISFTEQLGILHNEKNKLKDQLKDIDNQIDELMKKYADDIKDMEVGTITFDDIIQYTKYKMFRTTYMDNIIKQKCPEAIVKKSFVCNKISIIKKDCEVE